MRPPAAARQSPALRLLAARGRVLTARPRVVARGLAHRARGRSAWALWPDAVHPMQGADVAAPATAGFMRRWSADPVVPRRPLLDALRERVEPLSWHLARSGALLEPAAGGLAARAVEHVLGDELPAPRLVLFSPSGSPLAKVVCFAFASERAQPDAAVLAMADPVWSDRLRYEIDLVEELRRRLSSSPGVLRALPWPPLGRFSPPGDFAIVVRPDPLAGRTTDVTPSDRARVWGWLRDLHAATTVRTAPLGTSEVERALGDVREAWSLAPGGDAEQALALVRRAYEAVAGASVPVCAVHGDFWRGNVSQDGAALRVFDWEWGRLEGSPVFDLWTYELSDAQFATRNGDASLGQRLCDALDRVAGELAARELPPALAAATLAPAAAEMTLRVRRATGRPGPGEQSLLALRGPIEQALARSTSG